MNDSADSPWKTLRLREVASKIQDGTHYSPVSSSGPFRYLTSRNIRFGYMDLTGSGWLSESEHREIYRRCDPQRGDLLLTKDGANTGNATINPLDEQFSLLSSVAILRFDPAEHVAGFYLHYILSPRGQNLLKDQMSGNAITRLTLAKIKNFVVPVPPVQEQRGITQILDAIDEGIRSTERLIAKLEQAKQGLLRDILLRGIDKSGHLRDPERHPHKFHQTPIGVLPQEWPRVPIRQIIVSPGSFIQTGPFGSQLHANEYVAEGTPVVMPQDIGADGIDTSKIVYINSEKAAQLSRHRMREGDIVFARRGDLSKCAAITSGQDGWLCGTGCLLLRLSSGFSSTWLAALYQHDICQRQIAAAAVGTTMVNLNTKIVSSLQIPLPSSQEQQRISEVIATERVEIVQAIREAEKLRLLKQGLMDDLLTGRVRVGAVG